MRLYVFAHFVLLAYFFSGLAISKGFGSPNINFKDSQIRYLSGHDLLRVLAQHFPYGGKTISPSCSSLDIKNAALLGDPFALNGQLTYKTVSSAFIRWYSGCLKEFIALDIKGAISTEGNLRRYFGEEVAQAVSKQPYADMLIHPEKYSWATLNTDLQLKTIHHLLALHIGPGILKDESMLTKRLSLAVSDKEMVDKILAQLVFMIGTQDEFLSY